MCTRKEEGEKKISLHVRSCMGVYMFRKVFSRKFYIYIYMYIYFIITLKLIEKLIIDFCFLACHKSESFQFYLTLN